KLNRQIFFSLFNQYAGVLEQRYNSFIGMQQITKALERQIRFGLRSPPIKQFPFDPVLRLDLVDIRVNDVNYSLDNAAAIFGIDAYLRRRVRMSYDISEGFTNLECPVPGVDCSTDLTLRHSQGGQPIQVG